MFDDFDLNLQCEEFYEKNIDWFDADVENVTFNGEPLDGNYFDRMIENLFF